MRMKAIFSITCAGLLLTAFSSCVGVGGKDQLEYENTPYREYNFGKNDEISIQLPTSVLGEPYSLYSNYLRWKWIGSGFANYFTISDIRITKEKKDVYTKEVISIQFRNHSDTSFTLYREIVWVDKDTSIMLTFMTATSPTMKYEQETINRFVAEDNDLFEKILRSVRIKGQDGKLLKIKVDYDAIKKKIQEIYFAPERPSVTIEIPYELIEAEPVAPVAEQAKVQSGKDAK